MHRASTFQDTTTTTRRRESIFHGSLGHAQELIDRFAGSDTWLVNNRERVDFGEVIGAWVSSEEAQRLPTTRGIIHCGKYGAHIIPSQPEEDSTMTGETMNEEIIKGIANICARHLKASYEVAFPEGDIYRCCFENGEYDDNDEDLDSPDYEEWYIVDFEVLENLAEGPNKDPRYDFITISCKRMPSLVTCEGEIVFQLE